MTFTVDSCVIIAIANQFDPHHNRSKVLFMKRTDNLVILITVITEAIETYIEKFNRASDDIIGILGRVSGSPDFVNVFEQEFEKIVTSKTKRSIANFYKYVYALIEDHIRNKNFKELSDILRNHSYELATMISERVNSLKKVEEVILPDESTAPDREQVESIISAMNFPRGADRSSFIVLCVYAKDKEVDYFTTDGGYYLKMVQALNLIRKTFNTGLFPQHLTDLYIASLQ